MKLNQRRLKIFINSWTRKKVKEMCIKFLELEKRRDLTQVKCIKNGDNEILVEERAIQDRWRSYFVKLFSESV